jgi:hypothetical protein
MPTRLGYSERGIDDLHHPTLAVNPHSIPCPGGLYGIFIKVVNNGDFGTVELLCSHGLEKDPRGTG